MFEYPQELLDNLKIAQAYRFATEIFKKQYDQAVYDRLRSRGMTMLEIGGIEERMENLKFLTDMSHGNVQIWIGAKNRMKNYDAKTTEFETILRQYF